MRLGPAVPTLIVLTAGEDPLEPASLLFADGKFGGGPSRLTIYWPQGSRPPHNGGVDRTESARSASEIHSCCCSDFVGLEREFSG